MFESQVDQYIPKPRYAKIGPYIITLDHVHGIMQTKTESKEFPYQIYVTYTDKTSVVLEMPNKEECDKASDKIAEHLGAI